MATAVDSAPASQKTNQAATYANRPSVFAQDMLGLDLHPGQRQFVDERTKIISACAGRRWGKSYSTAASLLWFACTRHRSSQFVIAPTHDQAAILFEYVTSILGTSKVAALVQKQIEKPFPEIRLRNGSIMRFRSAGNDAKNLRGHGADRIVLDEAAFIPDSTYQAILPLLANSKYAELVLISTPWGMNTFYEYWRRGQDPDDHDVASFRFPSITNPYISKEYLEEQREQMTSVEYATEYGAEFHEDQASVFSTELIKRCINIDLAPPIAVDSADRYVFGFDPAKWQDRSALVVLDATVEPWAAIDVRDIAGRDYLTQAEMVGKLAGRYNRARGLMDSTSHDQMLEQLSRDGVSVDGYRFTNASKQELINGLVIAMEQGRLTIPNHPDLINELRYYRFERTQAGHVKLGAPNKRGHHDDLVTALALAVHRADGPGLPYSYLRDDPELRALLSGNAQPVPPHDPVGRALTVQETDEERIARRKAQFLASLPKDDEREMEGIVA